MKFVEQRTPQLVIAELPGQELLDFSPNARTLARGRLATISTHDIRT